MAQECTKPCKYRILRPITLKKILGGDRLHDQQQVRVDLEKGDGEVREEFQQDDERIGPKKQVEKVGRTMIGG